MQQLLFCCWIYSGYVIFYEIFIVIERGICLRVCLCMCMWLWASINKPVMLLLHNTWGQEKEDVQSILKKRYKRPRVLNVSCRLQYSSELVLRSLDAGEEEGCRKYWISLWSQRGSEALSISQALCTAADSPLEGNSCAASTVKWSVHTWACWQPHCQAEWMVGGASFILFFCPEKSQGEWASWRVEDMWIEFLHSQNRSLFHHDWKLIHCVAVETLANALTWMPNHCILITAFFF